MYIQYGTIILSMRQGGQKMKEYLKNLRNENNEILIDKLNYNQQKKAEAEKQQKIEQQEKAKKEAEQLSYKNHFQRAFLLMWTGAYQAQESCGLIHDVWYDTIYNKDESSTRKYVSGHSDFNDSLDALLYYATPKCNKVQCKSVTP